MLNPDDQKLRTCAANVQQKWNWSVPPSIRREGDGCSHLQAQPRCDDGAPVTGHQRHAAVAPSTGRPCRNARLAARAGGTLELAGGVVTRPKEQATKAFGHNLL